MRHDFTEKLDVVSEIICGKSLSRVARERQLDRHMVESWVDRYRRDGEGGLRPVSRFRRFTRAEKERIIWSHVEEGVSLRQLSLRHGVDRWTIKSWLRASRAGGKSKKEQGRERPMGRPKKREPRTELEKLQAENLRLRAENALLKKVKALVEEQRARARLNGQEPSRN